MQTRDSKNERETVQQLDSVQQRLAALEQVLAGQQARMAQQEEEIERLCAALAGAEQQQDLIVPASARRAEPNVLRRSASRRTLLKFGGAAAAAGVAAVAASAVEGAHVAHASGVGWATGTVSADTQTVVQQGGGWDNSNQLLELKLGSGSIFNSAPLKAAVAAYDTTSNQVGVYATSSSGYGLYGVTNSGIGSTGAGMNGTSTGTGTGVSGYSQSGIGVQGNSVSGIGASFTGGQAPLAVGLAGAAGAPTTGVHVAGEIFADSTGALYVCYQSGDFSTSNHPLFYRLSSLTFLSTPIRLLDTRPSASGAADTPGAKIQPGSANTFHLPVAGVTFGGVSIPSSAKALVGNCTVVNPSGVGDLAVYPDLLALPNTAVMHYLSGQIVSNGIVIGLGTNGKLAITALGSATDCIIDCQGFVF